MSTTQLTPPRPSQQDVRNARHLLANGPTFYHDNTEQWSALVACAWTVLHLDRAARRRCPMLQVLHPSHEGGAA